jgi:hypothetical protein
MSTKMAVMALVSLGGVMMGGGNTGRWVQLSDTSYHGVPVPHYAGADKCVCEQVRQNNHEPDGRNTIGQPLIVGVSFLSQRFCQYGPDQSAMANCHGRIRLATYNTIAHTAI